jgi:spheroidene monooxygenase
MNRSAWLSIKRPAVRADSEPLASAAAAPAVMLMMLMRYPRRHVPWGLAQLVFGARGIGQHPGLRFARVLGSGRDGGFGLSPGFDFQGLVCFFDDEASAKAFAERSSAAKARHTHAAECLTITLRASASRGSWAGIPLRVSTEPDTTGLVGVLTRASIRPSRAKRFWAHAPATHASLREASGCRLAIGLGEAPILRQATFSLWDSTEAMLAYARQGAHASASRAALGDGCFSESMFVRLRPLSLQGSWQGQRFG